MYLQYIFRIPITCPSIIVFLLSETECRCLSKELFVKTVLLSVEIELFSDHEDKIQTRDHLKRAPNLVPRTFSVFLKTLFTGYIYIFALLTAIYCWPIFFEFFKIIIFCNSLDEFVCQNNWITYTSIIGYGFL